MAITFKGEVPSPGKFRFTVVTPPGYQGPYREGMVKNMPEHPFCWGSISIGCHRLAYLMLLAATDCPLLCCDLKAKFVEQIVSKLSLTGWEMSDTEVLQWAVQEVENDLFPPAEILEAIDLREESGRA